MACETNVCGTGGWSGPKPGDPDNNVILQASPAFGGIDVTWSYPATNPYAVAHTLLYRGMTPDFDSAIQIAVVAGNFYYDKQDNNYTHYYWIRIVSINGTEGELIGPASATARRTIEQTIEDLTGLIDRGVLAQSLKEEIDKITLNYAELQQEIANRITSNEQLGAALAELQNGLVESLAFIDTETTRRTEGDSALLSQINTLAALNQQNAAAVITERQARVDADSALSQRLDLTVSAVGENAAAIKQFTEAQTTINSATAAALTTVQTTLDGDTASGQVGLVATVNTQGSEIGKIGALYTAKVQVNGLIGGFGVYNDGTTVEAGFDVDRFWIGRTKDNKRKPFIISDGVVYIDEAAILKVTFNKLQDSEGRFIVQNGKVKADYLSVTELMGGVYTGYQWPATNQGNGFYLGPNGFLMGNQKANRYFQITSEGNIYSPGFNMVNGVLQFGGQVIGTGALKDESVNIFKLGRGASLPDYMRTYKGTASPDVPPNVWLPLQLDWVNSTGVGALNNKIGAVDYDAYRINLPPGTYFYEAVVQIRGGNITSPLSPPYAGSSVFVAVVENIVNRTPTTPYRVLSKAGAGIVYVNGSALITGMGRFTINEWTMVSVAVTKTNDDLFVYVQSPIQNSFVANGPEVGYSSTMLKIWRDNPN